MLLFESFPVGPLGCNCSIVADGDTKDAIVVDPGGDFARIDQVLRHYDLTVRAIVHTHAHLDHIMATRDVKEAHGGEIGLHPDDLFLYDGMQQQAAFFGWKTRPGLPLDRRLAHGDAIDFGKRKALVIHTPGHTPGSCCFEVRDDADRKTLLFSGDTLFNRSIGRTDLPGGDGKLILRSIRERLYTRDLDAIVVPGHGPSTKLGDEARANPFVKATS
jgi:glyoxylase-like metal-dependent hydrolase (beta-lactamase superfamily II)